MEPLAKMPPVSAINYTRFLGRHVVKRLVAKELITQVGMPTDDYTPWEGYALTENGHGFVEAYERGDFDQAILLFRGKPQVKLDKTY